MKRFGRWIESLFEEHKLVRRFLVFWAVALISLLVFKLYSVISTITPPVAAVVGSIVGILSTVLVFYINSRKLDDVGDS